MTETRQEPLKLAKAVYFALPAKERRKWKDGTRLVRVRTQNSEQWRIVIWNN